MIILHHLGRSGGEFLLNDNRIVTVEGNPDTVITLDTGDKLLVAESPAEVADQVRACRIEILSGAMRDRRDRPAA